jgi:hypothetical protein
MRLDHGQIEAVDAALADVLRRKSGAERLAIANGMFVFARQLIRSRLHAEHPEWDDRKLGAETARRLSHGAI